MGYNINETLKGTFLCGTASFDVFCVKVDAVVLAVGNWNKKPQLSLRDVMLPAVACTARYSPSNYRVTFKLGLGSLKVIESATIR